MANNNGLHNAFEKITKSIKTLADTMKGTLIQSFKNIYSESSQDSENIKWTNYHCTSCGCNLIIKEHNAQKIYYECINCGKIHKSYKNNHYGGFK